MYFSLIVLVAEANKNIKWLFIIINVNVSVYHYFPFFLGELMSA